VFPSGAENSVVYMYGEAIVTWDRGGVTFVPRSTHPLLAEISEPEPKRGFGK
jgi:hypothetical protein